MTCQRVAGRIALAGGTTEGVVGNDFEVRRAGDRGRALAESALAVVARRTTERQARRRAAGLVGDLAQSLDREK